MVGDSIPDRRVPVAHGRGAPCPHSPEPAECGRAGGKTPRAGLDGPRPCRGIRGIFAPRRLRISRGGRADAGGIDPDNRGPCENRPCDALGVSGGYYPTRSTPFSPASPPKSPSLDELTGLPAPDIPLAERGADVNAKAASDDTPLDAANSRKTHRNAVSPPSARRAAQCAVLTGRLRATRSRAGNNKGNGESLGPHFGALSAENARGLPDPTGSRRPLAISPKKRRLSGSERRRGGTKRRAGGGAPFPPLHDFSEFSIL